MILIVPTTLSGESKQDAQVALKGTTSGDKNELLFSGFGINYNEIPQRFRKGTTLFRARVDSSMASAPQPSLPPAALSPIEQDDNAAQQSDRSRREAGAMGIAEKDSKNSVRGDQRGRKDELPATGVSAKLKHVLDATATHKLAVVGAGGGRGDAESDVCSSIESRHGTVLGESSVVSSGSGEVGDFSASGVVPKPKISEDTANTTQENAGAASSSVKKIVQGVGLGIVNVVGRRGDIGREKRLVKKGHAPPGVVEEVTCDIIRDEFWDRNPHLLVGVERRR